MISLTFIGHATWLIEAGGTRLITDPMFSGKIAGIWPRLKPPGLPLEALPPVDAVFISHPHLDHMDAPTLKRLNRNARLIVPRDTLRFAKTLGYGETTALDEWDHVELDGGVRITATPAIHLGIRGMGLGAAARGALGCVIQTSLHSVYFAGDTAYGPHFSEICRRFAPDVAMLPVGAYVPWFFMKRFHLSPARAVQAFIDLGAKWLVPYHYGTFVLSLEPVCEPLHLLAREASHRNIADRLAIVHRGETVTFGDGKPRVCEVSRRVKKL